MCADVDWLALCFVQLIRTGFVFAWRDLCCSVCLACVVGSSSALYGFGFGGSWYACGRFVFLCLCRLVVYTSHCGICLSSWGVVALLSCAFRNGRRCVAAALVRLSRCVVSCCLLSGLFGLVCLVYFLSVLGLRLLLKSSCPLPRCSCLRGCAVSLRWSEPDACLLLVCHFYGVQVGSAPVCCAFQDLLFSCPPLISLGLLVSVSAASCLVSLFAMGCALQSSWARLFFLVSSWLACGVRLCVSCRSRFARSVCVWWLAPIVARLFPAPSWFDSAMVVT